MTATSTTAPQMTVAYDGSNKLPISVNSSGDATLAPTGGDTAVTGNLAVSGTITGSRVAFAAHKNGANQTAITSATNTLITFATEVFDTGSYYDTGTSRWTPPPGKYRINATVFTSANIVDASAHTIKLYKNGALSHESRLIAASTAGFNVQITAIVEANGTDYFEVYYNGAGAGDKTIDGTASSTWFGGEAL
jgi:hypothetical protein